MDLGNRMKAYEKVSNNLLTRRTPVIIRVDGRCFHTFTRGFDKPFDKRLVSVMQCVANDLMRLSGTCVLAYIQSDEISILLNDWKELETQPFFENKIQKLASIFASKATSSFINNWYLHTGEVVDVQFDGRCFNIPKDEVCNYFLWRQQDWTRNSVQMVGRAHFSQKQMHQKTCSEIQEMLWSEKEINWDKLDTHLKRGTFFYQNKGVVLDLNCPILTQNRNYVEKHLGGEE